MNKKNISKVVIYLRKSRGDEGEDVLLNHRNTLIEYANSEGWHYDIYEEIASGERLSSREKIQEVLKQIEQGFYDGILVMDIDRLTRGSMKERGEILEVFQYANIPIITPAKTYDVSDIGEIMMYEIRGTFAHAELKKITERLVSGKKAGAKQGKLTNGKPPYPYEYEREIITDENGKVRVTGNIVVNPEKNEIYQFIKHRYLHDKKGTEEIAVWLNNHCIPSPNGSVWHNNAIRRLLVHEFHLGKVIYGKNIWKKDRNGKKRVVSKRDEREWSVGFGIHEQLKTQEEHDDILRMLSQNNKIPKRSRQGCFPTSGLMYCAKCGHLMNYSVGRLEAKTGKVFDYTKCSYKNPYGLKCPQRGTKMNEDFYENLYTIILDRFIDTVRLEEIQHRRKEQNQGKALLKRKKAELVEHETALNKIMEAYENGIYSIKQFEDRKKTREEAVFKLRQEIMELEHENQNSRVYNKDELKHKVKEFKEGWANATTSQEKNLLLKSVVKRIEYDREGNSIKFDITWL